MGVLLFDSTDRMRATSLASALQNVPTGARTAAWLFKRSATGTNFDALGYLKSGDPGTTKFGASIRNSDSKLTQDIAGGTPPVSVNGLTSTTEVYIAVLKIPAGTGQAAIWSYYTKSNNTWVHDAATGSVSNQTAADQWEIGAWQDDDWYRGWIGLAAFWNVQLTQAQTVELSTNWRTSDWYNNSGGTPVGIVELTSTTPTDLTGNATSWTNDGTTLDSGETLSSFNFNGTGSGGGATVDLDTANVTLDATGDLPAPAITASSAPTSPALDATGDLPAPTAAGHHTATSTTLDATGDLPAPSVTGSGNATVTSPALDSTGDLPVPSVSAGATVTSPALDATANLVAPANTISAEITLGPLSATGDLPAPAVAGLATVTSPALDATGDLPVPTGTAASNPASPAFQATGDLPTPAVTGTGDGTIIAPTLNATGATGTPALSLGSLIQAITLDAVADLPAPTQTAGATTTSPTLDALANLLAPSSIGDSLPDTNPKRLVLTEPANRVTIREHAHVALRE